MSVDGYIAALNTQERSGSIIGTRLITGVTTYNDENVPIIIKYRNMVGDDTDQTLRADKIYISSELFDMAKKEAPDYEGYMEKKAAPTSFTAFRGWQTRWCKLYKEKGKERLAYYNERSLAGMMLPKGTLFLSDMKSWSHNEQDDTIQLMMDPHRWRLRHYTTSSVLRNIYTFKDSFKDIERRTGREMVNRTMFKYLLDYLENHPKYQSLKLQPGVESRSSGTNNDASNKQTI